MGIGFLICKVRGDDGVYSSLLVFYILGSILCFCVFDFGDRFEIVFIVIINGWKFREVK